MIQRKLESNGIKDLVNRSVKLAISLLVFTSCFVSSAQTTIDPTVEIVPQKGKYLYRTGDTAVMIIKITTPGNLNLPSEVSYRLSADGDCELKEGTIYLKKGKGRIRGTLDKPGFRCNR